MAYLHINKMYLGYGVYCIQLEILGIENGLRPMTEVFHLAQEPNVSKLLKPFVTAASGFQIISLFPMVSLIVAIVGVGFGVGLSVYKICCLSLIVLFITLIYIVPLMVEYLKLVKHSKNNIKGPSKFVNNPKRKKVLS